MSTTITQSGGLALVAAILVLFPIAFVALWVGICRLLAAIGGWRRLARRFPAHGTPQGRRLSGLTGMVGPVSYRHVLTVHVSPAGLHLAVNPLFRPGHPPLFLPWSAIVNPAPARMLFWRSVRFEAGVPAVATLRLPEAVFEGRPVGAASR